MIDNMYVKGELIELHKKYLINKTHKGKPYTKSWLSLLLLENSFEEVCKRERLPINKRKSVYIKERHYNNFKQHLSDWYSYRECEEMFPVTKYIYKRIENYGERWRIIT